MVAIKKLVAPLPALLLTVFGLLLFNGCGPPGPRALLLGDRLIQEGNYAQAAQRLERATHLLPKEARAWNHLGLAYHASGRFSDASKAYQQALALDRNLAVGHFNLGSLYLDQTNLSSAVLELTSYTGLQPNAAGGWVKLGTAQFRAHQTEASEKSFRQALKLNPHLPEAWNGLGLVQTQRRRYEDAAQQFKAALREQPGYGPALLNLAIVAHQYLNNREFALHMYREYLALQPGPPNRGAVQQVASQLDQELRPSEPPLATNRPAQMVLRTNLAPAFSPGTNQPPQVAAALKSSISSNPPPPATSPSPSRASAAASPFLGTTQRLPNPSVAARAKTEGSATLPGNVEVVRVDDEEPIKPARDVTLNQAPPPDSANPAKTLVSNPASSPLTSSVASNKPAGQKSSFVQQLNPRNWFRSEARPATSPGSEPVAEIPRDRAPSNVRPTATGTVGSSSSATARYKYRSPAAGGPGHRGEAERLLAQGVHAQEQNRLSDAIQSYRRATNADPSFFDTHYNLGVAAYEAGDLPQCLSAYEDALAINPLSIKARFNFAVALQKAGYVADAANEMEKLLAADSGEARAHFALANLYAQQLGQPARARLHYLRVLELEPQHPQGTAIRYWLEANP
jgi:tetratricopeptide (TPR) repeat protein